MKRVSNLLCWYALAIAAAVLPALVAIDPVTAQVQKLGPVKHGEFRTFELHMKHLQETTFAEYKGLEGTKVANEKDFEVMKAHLIGLYKGAKVTHTFIGHGGANIDVIPIDQQPALHNPLLKGHKVLLTAPALHALPKRQDEKEKAKKQLPTTAKSVPPQLAKGMKDALGNEMFCPEGSIPVRRVTLTEMTKFGTLKDFLQKRTGPERLTKTKALPPDTPATSTLHRWAHAYQYVNNFGGSSWLNLWSPTPAAGNNFSLAQHWYVGGNPLQTLEGGWQVYPQKYGHNKPVLFIYWTADDYNNTGGYNLDVPGFVQVNHSFVIGGAWNQSSTPNGTQWGFRLIWYRDPANGNWWLYIQGAGAEQAIGYYPKALYGNGQMSKFATEIDYGGEVTGQPNGGQMGSGAFANTGWDHAAFQNDIYYFPTESTSAWANLTGTSTYNRYSIDVHNIYGNWGTYIYFGGPGGK
jgi:hypothetical protein